jgi:hypothetical protein
MPVNRKRKARSGEVAVMDAEQPQVVRAPSFQEMQVTCMVDAA